MADTLRQRLSTQRAWLLAGAEKTWMAPDIPGKKARSAIAAYAHRVREGDILFLFDETVFGSADRGLILTETHIHVKALFEPPASYAFTTMKKVGAAQSVIMVDGRLIIDLALAQKVTITRLCDLLNAHVASLRQEHCAVEPPAPTPTPQPKDLEPGSIIATQAAPPLRTPAAGVVAQPSGFSRNRIENSHFYRYRGRYVAYLRNSVDNLQYQLYLGIYDAFMGVATQSPVASNPDTALTWLVCDDETLFQSYILAVYCTGSQLSRHLDDDDVYKLLQPLMEVVFELAREELSRQPLSLGTAIDPSRAFMHSPRMQEFKRLHQQYKGALVNGNQSINLLGGWFVDNVVGALNRRYGHDFGLATQLAESQGADFGEYLYQYTATLHHQIERLLIDFFCAIWQ